MNLTKLIQFSLLIRINDRLREFNFLQRTPTLYDTNVSDERGNRFMFKLVKENEIWKVQGQNIPSWITENEVALNEALLNKVDNQY